MKKFIILGLVLLAGAATAATAAIATTTSAAPAEEVKDGRGFKCTWCNGTGWKGANRCFPCGGDGAVGD